MALVLMVGALTVTSQSLANDKNNPNNEMGPMTQKIPLGGNVAFNIKGEDEKPVELLKAKYPGMGVNIICAGPGKVYYYIADDHGPLHDKNASGTVEAGSQVKLVFPSEITGLARLFVQAKYGPTSGAAYSGPIIQIGRSGDVEDACKYINGLFGRAAASPKNEPPATWLADVKLYLLGEEIVSGVAEFRSNVLLFQDTADAKKKQGLIQNMELLNKNLPVQIKEFKQLSAQSPVYRALATSIRADVQFDLDENQSSLEIIHTDPSIWIKPTFRARRGKFPVNWLADMRKSLETAAEKQDGASRRDNVIPLIAYQLKLSDAQGELDQTLLDIESSPGKAVSDAKVKNDLQDLESMAISTTEMQTDTALSLTAFRSLLAEFEQVRSTNAAQKKYDSPLNDEKLWEQFGLKRQALKQACALLRQKLLRNL